MSGLYALGILMAKIPPTPMTYGKLLTILPKNHRNVVKVGDLSNKLNMLDDFSGGSGDSAKVLRYVNPMQQFGVCGCLLPRVIS